jgi:omega-6 fatty acid desaturase (delta-12 desaturase)
MESAEYQRLVDQYKHFRSKNLTALSITAVLLIAGVALIFYSSQADGPLWFFAQLLLGVVILQWFFLLHDLGHDHFFEETTLNVITGHLASLFCILPFFPWKYIHRTHHLWTGWKDRDPTMTIIIPRHVPDWKKATINFCWKYWIPIFTLSFSFANFWNVKKLNKMFPQYKMKNAFSIFLPSIFHLILINAFGLHAYFHTFGLGFFVFLVLCDPLLLSQHSSIPQNHSQGEKVSAFSFREQDQYTRSLVFPHWMSKYIFFGFNNHIVHHLIPTMPGYYLTDIKVKNANDENWISWLKKAKATKGFDLLLNEEFNLKNQK